MFKIRPVSEERLDEVRKDVVSTSSRTSKGHRMITSRTSTSTVDGTSCHKKNAAIWDYKKKLPELYKLLDEASNGPKRKKIIIFISIIRLKIYEVQRVI